MKALGSYGKFQGGSNTTEMITLAGRLPGHGEFGIGKIKARLRTHWELRLLW